MQKIQNRILHLTVVEALMLERVATSLAFNPSDRLLSVQETFKTLLTLQVI